MNSPIRVAIFEDNKAMREGLAMVVEMFEDLELCGTFNNANKVTRDIAQCSPDVVLMDIQMPGMNGIQSVQLAKEANPGVQILMQTVFEDSDKIFSSLCAGASGYILKNSSPEKIHAAILEVAAGGAYFTPSIAQKVLASFGATKNVVDYVVLSVREKEILSQLVEGLSYKMIASQLHISYETVHSHIKKIYEKLHVNSKSEAVSKAIRQKLV